MNKNILLDRAISAFPLSIGTSLAMESLFSPRLPPYDPKRIIPANVDIKKYQVIYINVFTLYRNMISSIPAISLANINAKMLYNALLTEIEIIDSLFKNEGKNICKPVYYIASYTDIKNTRVIKTDYQLLTKQYMDELNVLFNNVVRFKDTIKDYHYDKALILTHISYDLLSYIYFREFSMLESNTGLIKTRNKFYTKFAPCGTNDLSNIPFIRKMLLVFGDKSYIKPLTIDVRKAIVDIAKQRNWTPMTTQSKVMMDIELSNASLFNLIKQI